MLDRAQTMLGMTNAETRVIGGQSANRPHFEQQLADPFCADTESTPDRLIFNLAVALKDTWAKIEQKQK